VLVVGGSVLGVPYGIAGVAVGVAIAILYMYIAMGALPLRISGTTWGMYLRAHGQGVGVGLATGACAPTIRIILERVGAPSLLTVLAMIAACALV